MERSRPELSDTHMQRGSLWGVAALKHVKPCSFNQWHCQMLDGSQESLVSLRKTTQRSVALGDLLCCLRSMASGNDDH